MINSLNGEYRSIAAKYDDVLGIMVISQSLVTVHHAMYDHFEHTHAFIHIHNGLGKVSFTLNDQFIEW